MAVAAAVAAQGHGGAYYHLALLLQTVRQDFDGAEAAYRAAIAVDPGQGNAEYNLGDLLHKLARQTEAMGGDLAAAAAQYEECAQLWGVSEGADHELTKGARANAARLRLRI